MIRAVIIDDEYLARKRVESLLESVPFVKLIGEAKNGTEAVNIIHLKNPDLIFLDVEMPDFGGFEVLSKLPPDHPMPYVIFTTAYDQYAIRAFDVHALDYLLKPLDHDRFQEALIRTREQIALKQSSLTNAKISRLLLELNQVEHGYRSSFEIKEKGRDIAIFTDNIYVICANGNYLELQTDQKKYLYRSTMHALEEELNPKEFLRVHRSFFINISYIKSCRYLNNNEYKFLLKNGKEIISGRAYKQNIVDYLENQANNH